MSVGHIHLMDIKEVISRAGGCSRLASCLGIKSHTTVLRWKRVPDKYLVDIERVFGIPREEMRPDLFLGLSVGRPSELESTAA